MNKKKSTAACASLLFMLPQMAFPTCVVKTADLNKITTTAEIRTSGKLSFITPCSGEVKTDIKVMAYSTRDSAQRYVLHQGDNLKRLASASSGLKDTGNFYAVTKVLSSNLQERSGAQRFDPIFGLILGGPVLSGSSLVIPLGAYAWSETEKVTLSYGKRSLVLTPRNGFITVDLTGNKAKAFTLKQFDRQASFEVVGDALDAEFAAKYAALQKEFHEEDKEFARSQLATLFWEWGLSNNAISVTYEEH